MTATSGAAAPGPAAPGPAATKRMRFAAIDLGASSGRVMVAEVGPQRAVECDADSSPGSAMSTAVSLTEVHRFTNSAVSTPDGLFWNILSMYDEIKQGLRKVLADGPLQSIGIDTWAVDFGLLDGDGRLLGNPMSHRDPRTAAVVDDVHAAVSQQEFYERTGLQFLPFNTVYQLACLRGSAQWAAARTMLLIPDLIAYWLTGQLGAEATNASTTQLLNVHTGDWDPDLLEALGLPMQLFPPVRQPGSVIGTLRAELVGELGAASGPSATPDDDLVAVVAVGSHDTASAVVAVPASTPSFCFISSGTWSLVGVEMSQARVDEISRQANFSNELGVDGTIRYLRNVMGLWLLQQCLAEWNGAGDGPESADLLGLLSQAEESPALRSVFDCTDAQFIAPGRMVERIIRACTELDQPVPKTRAEMVRCVLDSLALAYRRVVRQAGELSGQVFHAVHVVGGGSQNALLCQLTADACATKVIAGPVEASAWGNVLIQMRAAGMAPAELTGLRAMVRQNVNCSEYRNRDGFTTLWDGAESRLKAG